MVENIITLNDYVKTVEHTNSYWMVRTMGGDYFDEYVRGRFIAIGYDEIPLQVLNNINVEDWVAFRQLKTHVREIFPNAPRPGHIASQLLRFCKGINTGDIIVLPGYSSYRLAICKVIGATYEVNHESCQGTGTWQQPRSSVLPSLVLTGKRPREDFFRGRLSFLMHLYYFSCILFGGIEIFRIFANGKNGTSSLWFTLFLLCLYNSITNVLICS